MWISIDHIVSLFPASFLMCFILSLLNPSLLSLTGAADFSLCREREEIEIMILSYWLLRLYDEACQTACAFASRSYVSHFTCVYFCLLTEWMVLRIVNLLMGVTMIKQDSLCESCVNTVWSYNTVKSRCAVNASCSYSSLICFWMSVLCQTLNNI